MPLFLFLIVGAVVAVAAASSSKKPGLPAPPEPRKPAGLAGTGVDPFALAPPAPPGPEPAPGAPAPAPGTPATPGTPEASLLFDQTQYVNPAANAEATWALIAKLISRGIPPTKWDQSYDIDQKRVLGEDLVFPARVPASETVPDLGLTVGQLAASIGPSALQAVQESVAPTVQRLFAQLASRISAFGFFSSFRIVDLFGTPPDESNLETKYPAAAYVAAAGAGRWGIQYALAKQIVIESLRGFNARHGFDRAATLLTDGDPVTFGTGAFWNLYGAGVALAEAFGALQRYARDHGLVDRKPIDYLLVV